MNSITSAKAFNNDYSGLNEEAIKNVKTNLLFCDKDFIEEHSKQQHAFMLKFFHNYLMFSKDDEILSKLKEFGLKKHALKWFVSLDEINQQFDLIEAKNILIDRKLALRQFEIHLKYKFSYAILCWATTNKLHDGVSRNMLTSALYSLKKKREYHKESIDKFNLFDTLLNNLINEMSIETKGVFDIEQFIGFSKGRSEKTLLRYVILNCFDYKELSQAKFLCIVYDLFSIVMRDVDMKTEKEYLNKKEAYTIVTYNRYKALKLKKILSI